MSTISPLPPKPRDSKSRYKPTWLDRVGPDGEITIKAVGYGLMVFGTTVGACFLLIAIGGGSVGLIQVLGVFVIAGVFGAVTMLMGIRITSTAGTVARAFTMPSGASTPYENQYSFQESMIARGDVVGALASYEAIIVEQPGAIAPRLRAAEHYARGSHDLMRAAELFRQVRDSMSASQRDAIYAANRLVDLYDGPLADPGRALVELRRIVETYPGTKAAEQARSALPGMKARIQGRPERGS